MGAAAVAVIMRKERDLVETFRRAGALSIEHARSLTQLAVDDRGVAWRRLTRRAVIREAAPGSFYLDLPSWEALRYVRKRMLLAVFGLMLLALVAVLLLQPK
jgi:hypothetical protein